MGYVSIPWRVSVFDRLSEFPQLTRQAWKSFQADLQKATMMATAIWEGSIDRRIRWDPGTLLAIYEHEKQNNWLFRVYRGLYYPIMFQDVGDFCIPDVGVCVNVCKA